MSLLPGVLACAFGIFFGDLLLYFAGRWLGRPILRWGPVRRFLTDSKVDRASAWLAQRGARVMLASHFTPGLRLPTYFAAGMLRTNFFTFAGYFFLAAAVWTPLLVGGTAWLGNGVRHTLAYLPVGGLALVLARRAPGLRKLARWEFWPVWLAYVPLIPWWIWLAIRYRSLTVFMDANPGIPRGGLVGGIEIANPGALAGIRRSA